MGRARVCLGRTPAEWQHPINLLIKHRRGVTGVKSGARRDEHDPVLGKFVGGFDRPRCLPGRDIDILVDLHASEIRFQHGFSQFRKTPEPPFVHERTRPFLHDLAIDLDAKGNGIAHHRGDWVGGFMHPGVPDHLASAAGVAAFEPPEPERSRAPVQVADERPVPTRAEPRLGRVEPGFAAFEVGEKRRPIVEIPDREVADEGEVGGFCRTRRKHIREADLHRIRNAVFVRAHASPRDGGRIQVRRHGVAGNAQTTRILDPATGNRAGPAEILVQRDGQVAVKPAQKGRHMSRRLHAQLVALQRVQHVESYQPRRVGPASYADTMPLPSPILKLHQQAEAYLAPWGEAPPAEGSEGAAVPPTAPVELVQTYGELELEYAAIRKACGLFDTPHRAVIEVRGGERLAFLNRMLTQELKGLKPREAKRSFWLNRKGRLDADLLLFETGASILIDIDIHAAARTLAGLEAFVIADDVAIADVSNEWSRFSLHGPTSATLLEELGERAEHCAPVATLPPGGVSKIAIATGEPDENGESEAATVWVVREDSTGERGLELFVPREHALAVYKQILEAGTDPGLTIDGSRPTLGHRVRLRPIGWHAFNIARIEAGTPIYNIDFGPENLPAESGIMNERVSFTKGCYLGQEIVARMHARGHPKQTLVALKVEPAPHARDKENGLAFMPVSGGHVFAVPAESQAPAETTENAVGVITSSSLSPMLAASPVCFAQVKWGHHLPGTRHMVLTEGVPAAATVQPTLSFWRPATTT